MSGWEGISLSGHLLDDAGAPVEDGHVYAYGEGRSGTLGPADAMSEPSGKDGGYAILLPRGTYTLVARKRLSGSISGPLRNGDLAGQVPKPVRAGAGDRSDLDIVLRVFRQGEVGDPKRILTTDTRVRGYVVDREGRPVAGIHVFAYRGPFRQDPPDYLSAATDQRGRFEISLPEGGEFTIGARSGLRGKPGPDDLLGFWAGGRDARHVPGGTVTEGVTITVLPFEDLQGKPLQ